MVIINSYIKIMKFQLLIIIIAPDYPQGDRNLINLAFSSIEDNEIPLLILLFFLISLLQMTCEQHHNGGETHVQQELNRISSQNSNEVYCSYIIIKSKIKIEHSIAKLHVMMLV